MRQRYIQFLHISALVSTTVRNYNTISTLVDPKEREVKRHGIPKLQTRQSPPYTRVLRHSDRPLHSRLEVRTAPHLLSIIQD